jgi:hypothetical protein
MTDKQTAVLIDNMASALTLAIDMLVSEFPEMTESVQLDSMEIAISSAINKNPQTTQRREVFAVRRIRRLVESWQDQAQVLASDSDKRVT